MMNILEKAVYIRSCKFFTFSEASLFEEAASEQLLGRLWSIILLSTAQTHLPQYIF
jgi:hypothetical protein